ncbi:hypothetical protein FXO38_24075 [Capsicum annuum]|nr:hypothetical protein FXO38_24075 [Capsicum annuum]
MSNRSVNSVPTLAKCLSNQSNMTIKIRGKHMYFRIKQIYDIYVLPNSNIGEFKEKGSEMRSWLAKRLCPKKEVSWMETKTNIYMNDLTFEARIFMNIKCRRVSPCTNMSSVLDLRAWMVVYILDDIPLDVG